MTDASSKFGLGWVYLQPDENGDPKVVSYGAQALTPSQRNYSALELELLALISALKSYECLCIHKKILCYSDNTKVLQLSNWRPINARQRRWLAYLMQFHLSLRFISGKTNYLSDCLSRITQDMSPEQVVQFNPDYSDKTDFIVSVDRPTKRQYTSSTKATQTDMSCTRQDITLGTPTRLDSQQQHDCVANANTCSYRFTVMKENDDNCGEHCTNELNVHASVFQPDVNVLTRNQKRLQNEIDGHKQSDENNPATVAQQSINIPTPQRGGLDRPQTDVREAEENASIPHPQSSSQPQSTFSPEADSESSQHCTPTADSTECSGDLLTLPTVTSRDYLEDNDFTHIYKYLTTGELSGDEKTDKITMLINDQYYIKDDLLYKLRIPRGRKESLVRDLANCLCVPIKFRYQLIEHLHNVCGHLGVKRNFLTLSARVFWKGLYTDIESYIKSCDVCQHGKRYFQKQTVPLHPWPVPSTVGEVWHLDHKNLARRTNAGNVAILAMVEAYSGWICLEAVPDYTAETAAKTFVRRAVANFGVPDILVTDKGSAYTGKFFQEMARILGIKHKTSASTVSRTNGLAESSIARFNQLIRCYADSDLLIEDYLSTIELSLRTTSHTELGISAFEIVQGRQASLGSPVKFEVDERFPDNQKAYLKHLHEKVGKIREGVKTLRELSKAKDSAEYNKRYKAREPTWQIGQQVLLKDARIKPNSDAVITHKPYAQPVYYIADIVKGDGIGEAYRLINADSGVSLKRLVPSDRLRPWNNERELLQSRLPPLYHKDSSRLPATQSLNGPVRSEQASSELVTASDKPGKLITGTLRSKLSNKEGKEIDWSTKCYLKMVFASGVQKFHHSFYVIGGYSKNRKERGDGGDRNRHTVVNCQISSP